MKVHRTRLRESQVRGLLLSFRVSPTKRVGRCRPSPSRFQPEVPVTRELGYPGVYVIATCLSNRSPDPSLHDPGVGGTVGTEGVRGPGL